jgi:transcriptional regulator with XRE-family HTH domain
MLTLERPQYTLTAFGDWLRDKRRRAGMSQDDLAIAADCSKTYISTLERGMHHTVTGTPPQPSRAMVEKLAIALGVPTRDALAVAFGVDDPGIITVRNIPGPIQNNPDAPVEARDLHDDAREEYDRIYFAFEGEPGFSKLTPSEKDALVRRAMEEGRKPRPFKPGDFRKAVEEAHQAQNANDD